jgi:hypothetical protein
MGKKLIFIAFKKVTNIFVFIYSYWILDINEDITRKNYWEINRTKTDTGGFVYITKVSGLMILKELGKLTP